MLGANRIVPNFKQVWPAGQLGAEAHTITIHRHHPNPRLSDQSN